MSDPSDRRRPPTDLEALTEVLAERAREGAGPEPEAGELLDYLEGRLRPEAEEAMQRRLVASPEATRKLLDLADLTEAGAAAGGRATGEAEEAPADLAVHAAWRDFRKRLPSGERTPSRGGTRHPWLVALAATLFVAVLGLGARVWQLERGAGPGAELLVANLETLELDEPVRSDRVPTKELEPGEPLQLVLFPAERCPSYRAELAGPSDLIALRLERNELGRVSFLIPGKPGRYTLQLFGCEPESHVSTYGFEIVRSGNDTLGGNGT
jgi:hypothetical protein